MTAPVFVVPPTALEGVGPGGLVRLDGPEGRKAVAIIEACYRSARTGRAARVAGA